LFVTVLLLTSAIALLTVSTPSNAQTDHTNVDIKVFLSARPNTVGLGQEILINFWTSPAPGANRMYHDYTISVTDPNGKSTTFKMDSYVADGTNWCPWVFDQVGDWTITFDYPGEYFAPGRYIDGALSSATSGGTVYADGVTIKPASARPVTIHVQNDVVPSWPESPLPTDYWTRPVDEINREWWPILGGYPWFGPATDDPLWNELYPNTNPTYNSAYAFTPWVSGPESAHIVWKRQYQLGGLMGGDLGGASSVWAGVGTWYQVPNIILQGRGYHSYSKPGSANPSVQTYWECYDIRTGEVLWERELFSGEIAPNIIEYGGRVDTVPGEKLKPEIPALLSISNGYLRKYDPYSGAMIANVSIAPMTGSGGTYYMNGYVLGVQDLGADAGAERYRLINWTTLGSSANFASRIVSNTTYARNTLPTANLIDWNAGVGCTATTLSQGGTYTGMNVTAFDLKTGSTIWSKVSSEVPYSTSACVADHGKIAIVTNNGFYLAYDLRTGNEVWRTRTLDYPWDASGFGSYSTLTAYGQLYWMAQSGIYAIDWNTGDINWKFEKEAPPFETPYTGSEGQTIYPLVNAGICADGKIYTYSNKHTPETPFYRGLPMLCIDAFTGKEVWSVGIPGGSDMRRTEMQLAIADGYLTMGARDGYMYVFGMGKSETTVSASQVPLALGQKALITGSVLDLSPAQLGAPCVSKDSMAAQMENIHLQSQIGGIYGNVSMVGVPVSLDVLDPNGNYYNIGMVTSDGYSGTFGYSNWVPDIAGQYTITATFMGDESYASSFATTYLTVAEGVDNGTNNTVLYAVIGATVAIIVVMVLCFLIFRKK
jgi:outer membrane protein assembly factor BamB